MRKRHTSPSNFKLIDDRTAVFAFLAFLVVVLFLFDSAADQQALNAQPYQAAGIWSDGGSGSKSSTSIALTKELADQVVSKLTIDSREKDGIAFIVNDTVDPKLLEYFTKLDYETVKAHLGLQSDFMIHFEDEKGMVIPMGDRFCIGSKSVKLNGIPCG